jgi:hypothetical protein
VARIECESCHGTGTVIGGMECVACSGSGDIADTGGTQVPGYGASVSHPAEPPDAGAPFSHPGGR